jgi:hypothetical protein
LRGDPAVSFPGDLRLLTLETPEPALGLAAYDARSRLVARSFGGAVEPGLLVLAQPNERYRVGVEALPGFPPDRTVEVTLRDRAAHLPPLAERRGLWGTSGIVVAEGGQILYLAHRRSVQAFDLSEPTMPVALGSVDLGRRVLAVAPCADARLCVLARGFPRTLAVLDLSDPGQPSVTGEIALPGRCRDLAVEGSRAYLACGGRGVLRVTLSDPGAPRLVSEIDPGGPATAVTLERKLLAVTVGGGSRIQVYKLRASGTPVLLAEAPTLRRGRRIHFAYPYLHVTEGSPRGWRRCLHLSADSSPSGWKGLLASLVCALAPTEVFLLDEQAGTVQAAGSYDTSKARLPLGAAIGRHVIVPLLDGFQVLAAEPAP